MDTTYTFEHDLDTATPNQLAAMIETAVAELAAIPANAPGKEVLFRRLRTIERAWHTANNHCERCEGTGEYRWGPIVNGRSTYAGVCFKCGGNGQARIGWAV